MDILGLAIDGRFAASAASILLGGFLRGFVGFGAALVSIPVMSLAYGPHLAIAASNVMGLPTLIQLLPDAIRHSEPRIVLPVSAAILLAAPLGTYALVLASPALMKIVISALVILMVAMLMRGWRLGQHVGMATLLGAGATGGLVQGSTGMGGPPVVAVALSRPGPAPRQRGNVLALMTAISVSSLAPLFAFGLFTREAIVLGFAMLPLNALSIWLGSRYFSRGGERHYRIAAYAVLAAVGVGTLVLALRDYLAV